MSTLTAISLKLRPLLIFFFKEQTKHTKRILSGVDRHPVPWQLHRVIKTSPEFNFSSATSNTLQTNEDNESDEKQADRMISTGELHMLPHLYPQPINVVVYHDPSGKTILGSGLALRCFQRLSVPYLATRRCP